MHVMRGITSYWALCKFRETNICCRPTAFCRLLAQIQVQELFQDGNRTRVPIPADGHCMFYCLATALPDHNAHTLRALLADTILRRPHLILPHFNESINDVLQANTPNYKGSAHYAQGMARRRWGCYIDMHILSFLLSLKINLQLLNKWNTKLDRQNYTWDPKNTALHLYKFN